MLNACQIIEKIIKIIKKMRKIKIKNRYLIKEKILSLKNMKKIKKKSNSQILRIKNIIKNKCLSNVRIQSIMKKKKHKKENNGLIKVRIQIKKLKSKKEIVSAKRTTKSRNKWTVYSNLMKQTNCSIQTIFKLTESVISTKYKVG